MDRDLQKLLKAIDKVIASDHRLRTGSYNQTKDRSRLSDGKVSVSKPILPKSENIQEAK